MNIEEFRDYCLTKEDAGEFMPFGDSVVVFKVDNKMFALMSLNLEPTVCLKCDPEKAIDLRERYPAVTPGYHMNKKHWNTVKIHQDVKDVQIKEWIKDSYNLVILTLPKSKRPELLKE